MNTFTNYVKTHKTKILLAIFLICVFAFFYVFFTKIHALVLFDTDDWVYASFYRQAIPIWKNWNPSRILPETFMPISTTLAVVLIFPICNNFIQATTIMYAIIVSLFIAIYVYYFMKLLKTIYNLPLYNNILITIIFLLFHFLIFRKNSTYNKYLFFAENVTCYFYYIIPALLNCTLVMYLMIKRIKKENLSKNSFIILLIYLAIFSNLFHSIILATYIASILLLEIIKKIKNKTKIKDFIKTNLGNIVILITWGISQIFELNGGRSSGYNSAFIPNFIQTLKSLFNTMKNCNKYFIVLSAIILIFSIILLIKDKKIKNIICYNIIFSGAFTLIYLILVCSKVAPVYITRPDIIFGAVFFGFLLVFLGLGYISKRYPKIINICPLLIFIIYFEINTFGNTFCESNQAPSATSEQCIAIDNYIINQIIEADNQGLTEANIKVPKFNYFTNDNWPIATYSQGYSYTLYEYGFIKNKITITYTVDESLNDFFGVSE
jgi:hypothetical protein